MMHMNEIYITNGEVHAAAGPELLAAVRALPPIATPEQAAAAREYHTLGAGGTIRTSREMREAASKATIRCDVGDAVVTPR